jgi:hypothetical protein
VSGLSLNSPAKADSANKIETQPKPIPQNVFMKLSSQSSSSSESKAQFSVSNTSLVSNEKKVQVNSMEIDSDSNSDQQSNTKRKLVNLVMRLKCYWQTVKIKNFNLVRI